MTTPPRRRVLSLLPITLALGATACGAAAQPGSFPTRDELSELAASASPKHAFDRGAVSVDTWELVAPLPDAADGAATDAQGPWGKILADAVASKPGAAVTSRSMECAARQVAAFVAAKRAQPAAALVRFIAARCGVPVGSLGMAYRFGDLPASTSEADVVAEWSGGVKEDLGKLLGGGKRLAGLAFARAGERAAVAIVVAERLVELSSVPLVPKDGKVVLQGRLLSPAESIRALVTRGRFGYEACIRDIEVNLPAFSIECPVQQDDPSARIELAAFQAGRDLGEQMIDLTVFPSGAPPQAFQRAKGEGGALAAGADAAPPLIERINAVRREAGMGEVRLTDAQSRTAAQLAPHYFAARSGELLAEIGDRVALGLLAGWDVEGMVREGHFTSQWIFGRSPGALVDEAIASPFGREALLDRQVSLIAVGAPPDKDVLAAVFGTYSLFDGSGKTDYVADVLSRLAKLRGKIKRAAPEAAPELDAALTDTVARVEGGLAPKEALDRLTEKSLEAISAGRVQTWFATASSVEKLEMPSELLSRASLRLGVGVAKYRPQGSPWMRLGVLFVAVEDTGVASHTARSGPAPRL